MKRKVLSLVLAVLLLLQLPAAVLAAETGDASAVVRAAYWADNAVHIYASYTGTDAPENLDVSLMYNNQVVSTTAPVPPSAREEETDVLLLVDRSLSAGGYNGVIRAFLDTALRPENADLTISLAAFDRDCQLLETGLKTYGEVCSAMWQITHNRENSDIGGAVAWGLEYLGERAQAGRVSNLVVITDGSPWYSLNAATQSQGCEEGAANASAMMAAYPDVTVHTLCLDRWEETTRKALTAGRGLHLNAASSARADDAGEQLAQYWDTLYRVSYPMPGYEGEAYITSSLMLCIGKNMTTVGILRNISASAPAGIGLDPANPEVPGESRPPVIITDPTLPEGEATEPTEPGGETTEPTEPGGEATEPADPTGETTEPTDPTGETTEPTEPTGETTEPTDPTGGATESTDPTGETDAEDPGEGDAEGMPLWLILVLAVLALAAAGAVALLLVRRKATANTVRMRVEILSGNVTRIKKYYLLKDQILIGSGSQCHIVVAEPGVAPVNTRIFKQGQMIYIEDMNSTGGTFLGGMRIYSSNRLRSGDEISVGTAVMRILF